MYIPQTPNWRKAAAWGWFTKKKSLFIIVGLYIHTRKLFHVLKIQNDMKQHRCIIIGTNKCKFVEINQPVICHICRTKIWHHASRWLCNAMRSPLMLASIFTDVLSYFSMSSRVVTSDQKNTKQKAICRSIYISSDVYTIYTRNEQD